MTSETDEKKAADDTSKKVAELAAKMNTMAKPVFDAIVYAIPIIIKYYHMLRVMIEQLPSTAFNALVGFIFCFFGGLYPVLFAAVQAAEHSGRKAVMDSVSVLSQEVMKIIEESKKDDQIDYDKDGKADVGQMETKEFVQRKLLLVLSKMDPNKIDTAISSIYKVWLAVAAVLTIEFAQTIALALSIADFIKQPVNRYLTPLVQKIIPDKYDKWVPVVLGWIAKSIAMSIAFTIQSLRSAFASALIGGLMISRAAFQYCLEHNITLGGIIKANHEDTSADELLSYVFAGMGFIFQLQIGFRLPFPFNFLLFPFEIGEYTVRSLVMSSTPMAK